MTDPPAQTRCWAILSCSRPSRCRIPGRSRADDGPPQSTKRGEAEPTGPQLQQITVAFATRAQQPTSVRPLQGLVSSLKACIQSLWRRPGMHQSMHNGSIARAASALPMSAVSHPN